MVNGVNNLLQGFSRAVSVMKIVKAEFPGGK